jgi:predicted HTH transcriptional regulator
MSDLIEEYIAIKSQLQKELQDIDSQVVLLEERRKQIREILEYSNPTPGGPAVVVNNVQTEKLAPHQKILNYVASNPGVSGSEIRDWFKGEMTEDEIKQAISYCSNRELMANAGNNRYSEWHIVK